MNVASVQAQWSSEPSCETVKEDQAGQAVNGELTIGWKASVGTSSKASWTVTRKCPVRTCLSAERLCYTGQMLPSLPLVSSIPFPQRFPLLRPYLPRYPCRELSGMRSRPRKSLSFGLPFTCSHGIIAPSFETSNDQTTERTYEFKNEANKQCKFNVRSDF